MEEEGEEEEEEAVGGLFAVLHNWALEGVEMRDFRASLAEESARLTLVSGASRPAGLALPRGRTLQISVLSRGRRGQ